MTGNDSSIMDRLVDKRGYDEIYAAIAAFVEDNPDRLDLLYKSNTVKEPDTATLTDIEIISTNDVVTDGDKITFSVTVSTDIEVEETVRRNRETDGVSQWFKVDCEVVLQGGSQVFRICDTNIYEGRK